jgi:hypothetical protein
MFVVRTLARNILRLKVLTTNHFCHGKKPGFWLSMQIKETGFFTESLGESAVLSKKPGF